MKIKNLIKKFIKRLFKFMGYEITRIKIRSKIRSKAPAFFSAHNIDTSGKDVYEFGVYGGESMKSITDFYKRYNRKIRKMFGFDSFEGLPEEKNDPYSHKDWFPGAFSATELFKTTNREEIIKRVLEVIGPRDFDIVLIPGFYDKVLEDNLVERYDMKPASYIDIDCDIYTSAYLALDFMFRNRLVRKNTLIGYDDWGGTLEIAKESIGGESRAHKEIEEKYNANFRLLYKTGTPPRVQVLFKVESIG